MSDVAPPTLNDLYDLSERQYVAMRELRSMLSSYAVAMVNAADRDDEPNPKWLIDMMRPLTVELAAIHVEFEATAAGIKVLQDARERRVSA
jgi:hypothetical protein